jgi:hypothetical protein
VVDVHIAPLEHEVSLSADIILTVSQLIHNRFDTFHKFKTKINHGVASYFFHPSSLNGDYFPAIRRRNGLNAGYVGNLENWCIDKGTLLKIVEGNPETDFYFIGPYGENSPLAIALKKLKNCVLLGRVPSQALPDFFQYMDLFLMCYDGADKEVNSNHHKILEFLSTGKPAVINYTDEYKDLRDLVIMADNNSELPALFSSVCKAPARYSTEVLQSKRKRYALANSYESQLQKIDLVIKSFLRP